MTMRTRFIGGVSVLLVLCLAVVATTSARGAEEKTEKALPNAALELHLALRLDEAGEPRLYFETPASDELLRLLINGQEKRPVPVVFLTATKDIPYAKIVKAIDRLGALGFQKISLDTKHEKAAP